MAFFLKMVTGIPYFIKKIIQGFIALRKSFKLNAERRKFRIKGTEIEHQVFQKQAELGRVYSEKRPYANELEKWDIPQKKGELEKAEASLSNQDEVLKEQIEQLRQKEKEFKGKIHEIEKIQAEKGDRLKASEMDLNYWEKKLKKTQQSIYRNEKRIQRAKEYKTMIPVPLVTQQQEKLNLSAEKLRDTVDKKKKTLIPQKEEFKKICAELVQGRREWAKCRKEIQSKIKSKKREREKSERNKMEKENLLQSAYFELGGFLDQDGFLEMEFHAVQQDLKDFKKQVCQNEEVIRELEIQLEEMSRDRRFGLICFLAISGFLVLYLALWVFPEMMYG